MPALCSILQAGAARAVPIALDDVLKVMIFDRIDAGDTHTHTLSGSGSAVGEFACAASALTLVCHMPRCGGERALPGPCSLRIAHRTTVGWRAYSDCILCAVQALYALAAADASGNSASELFASGGIHSLVGPPAASGSFLIPNFSSNSQRSAGIPARLSGHVRTPGLRKGGSVRHQNFQVCGPRLTKGWLKDC